MPRMLGVDYGKVRVGLAVSDALGHTAHPLEVIRREKGVSLIDAVLAVARRVEAEQIVVGLPLRMDGTPGVEAEAARSFARALGDRGGIQVVLWDERLSTTQASRDMRASGMSEKQQRGVVDKVAAAVILRAFIEATGAPATEQAAPPEPDPEPVLPQRGIRDDRDGERRGRPAARPRRKRPGSRDWREDASDA